MTAETKAVTQKSIEVEPAFKKRAPTLYAIIVFKLLKGTLFLVLAIVLYCLSDNDLPAEYQHLLHHLRVQPGNQFWSNIALKVGRMTEIKMIWTAVGSLVYSMFSLVEGSGLLFRVSWAGWLAIGESAFFIPIEIYELVRRPVTDHHHSGVLLIVLILNIFIVWYLLANRKRLFRHHH
jgi:uncharacterized membrane protein (DUF2068 family)